MARKNGSSSYRWPSYVMPRKPGTLQRIGYDPSTKTLAHLVQHAFTDETEFMQYVRLIPGGNYDDFLKAWEEGQLNISSPTSTGRPATLSLDVLAARLNIDPLTLKLDLVRTCDENCLDVSRIMSSIAHPHVVLRNIKEALKPGGVKDRSLFFERRGELPRSGVNVNVDTRVTAVAGAKVETTPLPDFAESTVEVSKIVRDAVSSES